MLTYLLLALGLVLLFLGGDWLVIGASTLATRYGVPPMIVGLTIVGFGTSTPELLVSVQAALNGQSGIAIGNVIGSNIANILLIGGVTAVIAPMLTPFQPLKRDLTIMLLATLCLPLILWSGSIGIIEGSVLLAGLAAFLMLSLRSIQKNENPETNTTPLWQSALGIVVGLVALMIGANLLVQSASTIARTYGISEAMIGLSVVAIGTSLPELATSVIAALRGQREIAIGNIIGSNIFNLLFILGLTAVITPIPAAIRFLTLDTPVLIGATAFLVAAIYLRGQIGRVIGTGMIGAYLFYIGSTAGL